MTFGKFCQIFSNNLQLLPTLAKSLQPRHHDITRHPGVRNAPKNVGEQHHHQSHWWAVRWTRREDKQVFRVLLTAAEIEEGRHSWG